MEKKTHIFVFLIFFGYWAYATSVFAEEVIRIIPNPPQAVVNNTENSDFQYNDSVCFFSFQANEELGCGRVAKKTSGAIFVTISEELLKILSPGMEALKPVRFSSQQIKTSGVINTKNLLTLMAGIEVPLISSTRFVVPNYQKPPSPTSSNLWGPSSTAFFSPFATFGVYASVEFFDSLLGLSFNYDRTYLYNSDQIIISIQKSLTDYMDKALDYTDSLFSIYTMAPFHLLFIQPGIGIGFENMTLLFSANYFDSQKNTSTPYYSSQLTQSTVNLVFPLKCNLYDNKTFVVDLSAMLSTPISKSAPNYTLLVLEDPLAKGLDVGQVSDGLESSFSWANNPFAVRSALAVGLKF